MLGTKLGNKEEKLRMALAFNQRLKYGLSLSECFMGMNVNSSSLHLKSLGYWEVSQTNIPQ